jgi:hypothetical protein
MTKETKKEVVTVALISAWLIFAGLLCYWITNK